MEFAADLVDRGGVNGGGECADVMVSGQSIGSVTPENQGEGTYTSKQRAPGTMVPSHLLLIGQFHGLSRSSGESQSSGAVDGSGVTSLSLPISLEALVVDFESP